jgi:hypothetical protein
MGGANDIYGDGQKEFGEEKNIKTQLYLEECHSR